MSADDKDSIIINRSLAKMMKELRKAGIKVEAVVGFVVFEGMDNFNLVTLMDDKVIPKDRTVDQARLSLLSYAHNEICDLIEQLDPEPGDGPAETRH